MGILSGDHCVIFENSENSCFRDLYTMRGKDNKNKSAADNTLDRLKPLEIYGFMWYSIFGFMLEGCCEISEAEVGAMA